MATAPEGGYDYDLVVIGGGSGGLAASKVRVGSRFLEKDLPLIQPWLFP